MDTNRRCAACRSPLSSNDAACPRCGTAVQVGATLTYGAETEPGDAGNAVEHRLRVQDALGSGYELQDLLGQGGFGAVYAAWDVQLERRVAVKVIRQDRIEPEYLERFRREARAVARLQHPNVLPVYHIGDVEGLAFMVMPLVAGESLRQLISREKQLAPDEARRILLEVSSALAAAHDVGIVHRDVKPDNIMLEGRERRALLMDFGIATAPGSSGHLTATGAVIGTPAYMSPEQLAGTRVGPTSDIFSLGVVAYEMMTGRVPFEEGGLAEWIFQHRSPGAPDLTIERPEIPTPIAEVVARCLALDSGDRWASGEELRTALATVPDLPAHSSHPPEVGLRTAIRQRRCLYAGGGACLALFALLWSTAFPPPYRSSTSESEARALAGELFQSMGAEGAFTEFRSFVFWNTRRFLHRHLGAPGAYAWMDSVLPAAAWRVRWIGDDGAERWTAEIAGGRIVGFDVVGTERDDRVVFTEPEQLAVAQAFLAARRVDPAGLELVRRSTAGDTDETTARFVWLQPSRAVPWTGVDDQGATAPVVVTTDLAGDRVTRYEYALPFPNEAIPASELADYLKALANLIILGLGFFAIVGFIRAGSRLQPRWRTALTGGALLGALIIAYAGSGWSKKMFALSDEPLLAGHMAAWIGTVVVRAALIAGVAAIFLAYGEWVGRRYFPRSVRSFVALLDGNVGDRSVGVALLDGYALGAALLAYEAVYFTAVRLVPNASGWFGEAEFTFFQGTNFTLVAPTVYSLLHALLVCAMLVFAVALFQAYLRRTWLTVLVVALLGGVAFLRVTPMAFGILESAGLAVILTVALLRLSLLACVVAEFFMMSTISGLGMAASRVDEMVAAGVATLALVLVLPGLLLTRQRGRETARRPRP